jgi:CRISPR-associated endonuclease Csn1
MLEDEFDAIWSAQAAHHPAVLTEALRDKVQRAIFFQRSIKSQRHLIGYCDLERTRRRAPMCTLAAQRFRLLQKVNDLLVEGPDGKHALTADQRDRLLEALEAARRLSFPDIRRMFSLPRGTKFNFETEGEKSLPGNRTAHDLAQVFGSQQWSALTPDQRDRAVEDLRSIHNRDALKRRAAKAWGLQGEAAQRFAEIALEDGYCDLSRQALAKVLPLMEQGMQFATARKQLYGDEPPPAAVTMLPRLESVLQLRNPAVQRALTELRKVVNAIVREYGKPDRIRIELARDLKKPRKDRQRISRQNARNRAAREVAGEEIEDLVGPNPSRDDRVKLLLWKECGGLCPYTGKPISREALFGDHPQFQVEHIIPFPRCLDDSFMNKTLCEIEENRRKGNRTPWEAYHGTDQWEAILGRVKQFRGDARRAKVDRFQTEELPGLDDFTTQQLNDTRYASRLAVEYVAMLYGAGADGVDPQTRTKRVEASRGAATSYLRDEWDLNTILGGGEKTRDNHKQHAIDAIVIALTDPAAIKRLSAAAARAPEARRRRFAPLPPPWEGFLDHVRALTDHMVVSHRVSRKVSAAIHEETIYSKPQLDERGKPCVHVRKPLESITKKDLPDIVDPAVREAVAAKLEAFGDKAFKDRANHPTLRAKDGRMIPIHKVRLRTSVSPEQIGGDGAYSRSVKLGSNHHVEIIETQDKKGNARWEGCVVTTKEAMRRLKAREPIIRRDHGPAKCFLFSLAGGEIIELDAEQSKRQLFAVRTITVKRTGRVSLEYAAINDARKKNEIQAANAWGMADVDPLRKRHCRKVVVTPLGEVRTARD